ncbi:exopolyphosphatase [Pseudohyphozyma bogoriensis]|nr:exopolyphosphatase [Pseudohyphozyma bogoriensis]
MAATGTTPLHEWLETQKSEFVKRVQGGESLDGWTVVMGNEAGDLDSLASSISYAYLSSLTSSTTHYIPLILTPSSSLHLRPENLLVLSSSSIPNPSHTLLTISDLPTSTTTELGKRGARFALVDHNALSGMFGGEEGEEEWVEGVIDHHVDEGRHRSAHPRLIDPVGSCAALVATYFLSTSSEAGVTRPPELSEALKSVSLLLLSSILIDTNLRPVSEGGKATPTDEDAVRLLLAYSPPLDALAFPGSSGSSSPALSTTSSTTNDSLATLAKQLNKVKDSVAHLSGPDLLGRDYKSYSLSSSSGGEVKYGIATVPLSLEDAWVGREDEGRGWKGLLSDLKGWCAQRVDLMVVSTTFNKGKKGKKVHSRELLVYVASASSHHSLERVFGALEAREELGLELWPGEGPNVIPDFYLPHLIKLSTPLGFHLESLLTPLLLSSLLSSNLPTTTLPPTHPSQHYWTTYNKYALWCAKKNVFKFPITGGAVTLFVKEVWGEEEKERRREACEVLEAYRRVTVGVFKGSEEMVAMEGLGKRERDEWRKLVDVGGKTVWSWRPCRSACGVVASPATPALPIAPLPKPRSPPPPVTIKHAIDLTTSSEPLAKRQKTSHSDVPSGPSAPLPTPAPAPALAPTNAPAPPSTELISTSTSNFPLPVLKKRGRPRKLPLAQSPVALPLDFLMEEAQFWQAFVECETALAELKEERRARGVTGAVVEVVRLRKYARAVQEGGIVEELVPLPEEVRARVEKFREQVEGQIKAGKLSVEDARVNLQKVEDAAHAHRVQLTKQQLAATRMARGVSTEKRQDDASAGLRNDVSTVEPLSIPRPPPEPTAPLRVNTNVAQAPSELASASAIIASAPPIPSPQPNFDANRPAPTPAPSVNPLSKSTPTSQTRPRSSSTSASKTIVGRPRSSSASMGRAASGPPHPLVETFQAASPALREAFKKRLLAHKNGTARSGSMSPSTAPSTPLPEADEDAVAALERRNGEPSPAPGSASASTSTAGQGVGLGLASTETQDESSEAWPVLARFDRIPFNLLQAHKRKIDRARKLQLRAIELDRSMSKEDAGVGVQRELEKELRQGQQTLVPLLAEVAKFEKHFSKEKVRDDWTFYIGKGGGLNHHPRSYVLPGTPSSRRSSTESTPAAAPPTAPSESVGAAPSAYVKEKENVPTLPLALTPVVPAPSSSALDSTPTANGGLAPLPSPLSTNSNAPPTSVKVLDSASEPAPAPAATKADAPPAPVVRLPLPSAPSAIQDVDMADAEKEEEEVDELEDDDDEIVPETPDAPTPKPASPKAQAQAALLGDDAPSIVSPTAPAPLSTPSTASAPPPVSLVPSVAQPLLSPPAESATAPVAAQEQQPSPGAPTPAPAASLPPPPSIGAATATSSDPRLLVDPLPKQLVASPLASAPTSSSDDLVPPPAHAGAEAFNDSLPPIVPPTPTTALNLATAQPAAPATSAAPAPPTRAAVSKFARPSAAMLARGLKASTPMRPFG